MFGKRDLLTIPASDILTALIECQVILPRKEVKTGQGKSTRNDDCNWEDIRTC